MKNLNLKELTIKESRNIQGGSLLSDIIGVAKKAAALYETLKRFTPMA